MCTAVTYMTKDFYFGRTLDNDFSYGDTVTITPRNFPFQFQCGRSIVNHYAIIGMAHIAEGYPLYYDAVNEKGLCMAGLNFVGNAVYRKSIPGRDNIPQFELIPWILTQCGSVQEVKCLLEKINVVGTSFSKMLPCAQLHWIIADRKECITLECVAEGMRVYDNPVGVLTNNPPFDMQFFNLSNYMQLSSRSPENHFSNQLALKPYSRGMGALGLPGDLSSQSRFVRAAFTRTHACSGDSEEESVSQFFHILGSVEQQRGCCVLDDGKYEITLYTSCCNADKGIYYYTTYGNHRICAVDMHRENLDGASLILHHPVQREQILYQN